MYRISVILLCAFGFVALPTWAEPPAETPQKTSAALTPGSDALPQVKRPRLSTRDRWRGRPYVRSSNREAIPSEALDKALPMIGPASGSGAGSGAFSSTTDVMRNEALDTVLPMIGPASRGAFGQAF